MKFIFCTCNVSVADRITSLLEENKIRDYQLSDHVIARSVVGTPRFDNAIWPGYNVTFTMQFSNDERAMEVLDLLRKFNRESAYNDEELLTVCSWNMENYFYD